MLNYSTVFALSSLNTFGQHLWSWTLSSLLRHTFVILWFSWILGSMLYWIFGIQLLYSNIWWNGRVTMINIFKQWNISYLVHFIITAHPLYQYWSKNWYVSVTFHHHHRHFYVIFSYSSEYLQLRSNALVIFQSPKHNSMYSLLYNKTFRM